jgi:two-component system CheB/CheR fusion protein
MAETLSFNGYLAAVLNYAEDAILSLNNQAEITSWNPAAERLFGYSQAEAVGQPLEIIVPPSRRAELAAMLDAVRSGHHQTGRELTCCRSDGSLVQVEMSLAAVRDQGRDLGLVVIASDVSERQRAEAALRNSEKMAATGRLAALIAHEINNPLESVTNLLYLLEHDASLDERAREYVRMATEELGRVVHITRQTLGFYREAAVPVAIRVSELLGNVLELYSHRMQARHIRVETRFGPEPEIRGLPGEMRQVFANLIVNALEAVGQGGEIKLHVYESRDWNRPERRGVRVVVADNGPGIAPEHRRHIFEPFYTTKGERGTGLGLWVSRGIVDKCGGTIRVRSSLHPMCRGTVFSVFLPAPSEENLAKAA